MNNILFDLKRYISHLFLILVYLGIKLAKIIARASRDSLIPKPERGWKLEERNSSNSLSNLSFVNSEYNTVCKIVKNYFALS